VREAVAATLEVVPSGRPRRVRHEHDGLTWEDSTILIDAGVMFPDPDQLGVDLIIPDLTYVEARRRRSRRSSSRTATKITSARAARDAALRRPGLRHGDDAGAVEPKLESTASTPATG
jgi:hypothetical protein